MPTDNIYAQPAYNPERVKLAAEYAKTKFFRLTLDLMRLAQWDPLHPSNVPMGWCCFYDNQGKLLPTDDISLYKLYSFTPAMIKFSEERYHDELRSSVEGKG